MKRKFSLKTVLAVICITVFATSFLSYVLSSNGVGAGRDLYFDDLPSTASYVINTDGTYTWATRYDGYVAYGGSANRGGVDGTDSSAIINACIGNLTSGRTQKETVALRGDFTISNMITIPNYTILDLTDAKLTLANNIDQTMFKIGSDSSLSIHVEIQGGYLDCNKANQASGGGFNITGQFIDIIGTRIYNVKDRAIEVGGLGLGMPNLAREINLDRIFIQSVDGYGLYVDSNVAYLRLLNSHLKNNDATGTAIYCPNTVGNSVGSIWVENNYIYGWGTRGIYVFGTEWFIDGNYVFEIAQEGIRLEASSTTAHFGSKVVNNHVWSVGKQTNNTYAAILLNGDATYAVRNTLVSGNLIGKEVTESNMAAYGIKEVTKCHYNIICNNQFDIIGSDVVVTISLAGSTTRVYDNKGYNPIGLIANPAASGYLVDSGVGAIANNTEYTIAQSNKLIVIQTDVIILQVWVDSQQITSSLEPLIMTLVAGQTFKILWSSPPTIKVFGQ